MKRQLIILAILTLLLISGCGNDYGQIQVECHSKAELNCGQNNIRDLRVRINVWSTCYYTCRDYSIIKELVGE